MNKESSIKQRSGWIGRLILLPPIFIFSMVGMRFILHPATALGASITLGTAQAVTHMRVFGVFALGYPLGLALCWFSGSRLRTGLSAVALFMAAALVVRAAGVMIDGTPIQQESRLFIAEIVFLVLSLMGLWIEPRQQAGGTHD